jgi:hypothetical protein
LSAVARRAKAEACSPSRSEIGDRWWARRFAPLPTLRDPPSLQVLSLVIASAAKQSILPLRGADGLLRYARNDVDRHGLASSRRIAPELWICFSPQNSEGAGKAGAGWHPRSRVQWVNKSAHEHTGISRGIRPSLRNGFTAYSALSLETNFPLASIAGELTTFRSPVGPGKSPPA